MRAVGSKRIPSIALLGCVLALALATTAPAGTIGFTINTTVHAGPGIRVELEVQHTGDEAARDVTPELSLIGETLTGRREESISPGAAAKWEMTLREENLEPGVYVLVVSLAYADANAYPFQVVTTSPFNVGAEPKPRLTGRIAIPQIEGQSTVDATIEFSVPPTRTKTYDIQLYLPAGVEASPNEWKNFDAGAGTVRLPVKITNRNLLDGSVLDTFALLTGQDEAPVQTDRVRGLIRIGTADDPLSSDFFVKIAIALAAALVLLQIAWWRFS